MMDTEFIKVSEAIEDHLESTLKMLPKENQKEALQKLIILMEVYRDDLAKKLKEGKSESSHQTQGLLEKGKRHLNRNPT